MVDGRAVAHAVKSPSPATPFTLLTGCGAFLKEDEHDPPEVDSVMIKPPRVDEIRSTFRRVTRKAVA